MRIILVVITLLAIFTLPGNCSAEEKSKSNKADTPSYEIVSEYIRTFGVVHGIQQDSIHEDGRDNTQTLLHTITQFTRLNDELTLSITRLKSMTLIREQFNSLIPATVKWYEELINYNKEIIRITKQFIGKPKPGVDYSDLLARMAEIQAKIEYISRSLFQTSPLVCMLMIDEIPDKEGHMSHLNITSEQKQQLIDEINSYFSDSQDSQDDSWTVQSAKLIKEFLEKPGYICVDEWRV